MATPSMHSPASTGVSTTADVTPEPAARTGWVKGLSKTSDAPGAWSQLTPTQPAHLDRSTNKIRAPKKTNRDDPYGTRSSSKALAEKLAHDRAAAQAAGIKADNDFE